MFFQLSRLSILYNTRKLKINTQQKYFSKNICPKNQDRQKIIKNYISGPQNGQNRKSF